MTLNDTVRLAHGAPMPRLGLGVYKAKPGHGVRDAVRWALEAGYRHLDELLAHAGVAPAVDQVEYSPYLPQRELLACCRERGIQLERYSPLKGRRLGDARLRAIAERHGKTAASDGASHGVSHGVSHGTGGSVGRTGGIRLDECLSVR